MTTLPLGFEVRLTTVMGQPLHAKDVLVGVNFILGGRYYYGNLIGLTDAKGVAKVERPVLVRRFESDRAAFPMDYKVGLETLDSCIEVMVLNATEIATAVDAVESGSPVGQQFAEMYQRAQNVRYTPAVVRIDTSLMAGSWLVVSIPTAAVG